MNKINFNFQLLFSHSTKFALNYQYCNQLSFADSVTNFDALDEKMKGLILREINMTVMYVLSPERCTLPPR